MECERHTTRGRPATGRSPILTLTVTAAMLASVDRSAADHFEGRRDAVRRLLLQGLASEAQRSALGRSRGLA